MNFRSRYRSKKLSKSQLSLRKGVKRNPKNGPRFCAPICVAVISSVSCISFHLQMSFTSSNTNPTTTARSCSSMSYSTGNLSSGTGAPTTSMSNVLPSSSTSTPQSLNTHSAILLRHESRILLNLFLLSKILGAMLYAMRVSKAAPCKTLYD